MADEKPARVWTRPEEVIRLHKLKMKKKALQARMEKSLSGNNGEDNKISESNTVIGKRKNPFKMENTKKIKLSSQPDLEISNDNTLFQLLNMNKIKEEEAEKQTKPQPRRIDFSNILSSQSQNTSSSSQRKINKADDEIVMKAINEDYIPIDWTLKSKLRFLSSRPFTWNQKLKTSEESSGITAFVRCLDPLDPNRTVDTSTNALFHQFCLVWQHPSLPWLETFPRTTLSSSDKAHLTPSFIKEGNIKESLYQDWVESFSSLFQLLRAKQCPYFYIMANQFTCLFRAAGICGIPEMHALLTPTTRGFRKLLKDDDVKFSMPLNKTSNKTDLEKRWSPDTGYGSLEQDENNSNRAGSSDPIDSDFDDEEDNEAWLEECGLGRRQIQEFNTKQKKIDDNREKTIDRTPESLIYVEGVEVQALFNFLVNCKSATPLTGPLAGIPPTLLSSVAFHGATLKTLKAKQGIVKIENKKYHSMELRGPILPHTIHNLCNLLEGSFEEFSVTFANIEPTKSFCLVTEISESWETRSEEVENNSVPTTPSKKPVPSIFGRENLSDCGLSKKILDLFTGNEAYKKISTIESLKHNSNKTYSWL